MDSRSPTPEIPDSQESQDSQSQSQSQSYNQTTRDDRIAIRTALRFGIPYSRVREVLKVTESQIKYAKTHPLTPQHRQTGKKPAIRTPQKKVLETWLLQSPSHRRMAYKQIPLRLPELSRFGNQAINTAMRSMGYTRRTAPKKGFSDDPVVMAERVAFAKEAIQWDRERLYQQIFSDEVWAMGGAHTVSYITVKEDGTDRYLPETVTHKYSKAPAWMFHGTIVNGHKGPAIFWEKEWGNMKSSTYDTYILARIQLWMQGTDWVWMQDGASSHRSKETQRNLIRRAIRSIQWPRYSPDLNLIEHVWNWMKNYIQEHYWQAKYDVAKVPLDQLKAIIWEAWNAVPDSYIDSLYQSWWRRCQAVIDAKGGPTKY